MRIAVFGAGGIGGYFGGRLAAAGAEIHLIARGEHRRAIAERGLRIRSGRGDLELRLPVTEDPEEIGPCDYVLFSVKSFDTESAAARLGPLLQSDTAVLSLQNGIDNEEKIAAAVGRSHVMGGAAFILATIEEPGVIAQVGDQARIVFGELDGRRTPRAERLLSQCRQAGIDAELAEDIRKVLWSKFALICAVAGMTAAVRLAIGEIREAPESLSMYRALLEEVVTLARAEGIDLPETTVESHLELTRELSPDYLSSLHYDMTHGKPMELEALHGTVLRLAEPHGLSVPMHRAVYAILRPWEIRNRRSARGIASV